MTTVEYRWMLKDVAIKAMTETPVNREGPVRQLVEGFGGKLICYYFILGEYDGLAICEFPDLESATAASMRVTASGSFARFETHVLMSPGDAEQVMRRVKSTDVTFRPPAG